MPKAYYKIEDVEAQEFVGKCLQDASKRPSANELLMDPFLALDDDNEAMSVPAITRMPSAHNKATSKGTLTVEIPPSLPSPPSVSATKKDTKMMITGTMNPDDDAIFLKVQIPDKNGMYV